MKRISLTKGKFALVDDEDYDGLMKWSWTAMHCGNHWYAKRGTQKNGKQEVHLMHRQILGLSHHYPLVDHIDRDGLNNQKSNLRTCGKAGNSINRPKKRDKSPSSKFKGVSLDKRRGTWHVCLMHNQKHIHVGDFKTEIDAAKAYDKKAVELWGDFARTNKMLGLYDVERESKTGTA